MRSALVGLAERPGDAERRCAFGLALEREARIGERERGERGEPEERGEREAGECALPKFRLSRFFSATVTFCGSRIACPQILSIARSRGFVV